jgi:sigma-B regulation protein RsbU (phosphoserine phosphatase)
LEQKNQIIQEELKMARELQLAMLPHNFPGLANGKSSKDNALEFFSFYFPTGAVSGDFFHVVELSDTSVGVFICDVMGHDVRAALVTAMMRALVEEISAVASDPGQLLAQINQGLVGIFKQTGATMYATAFYLIADVARGELRYSSAAHPDPLHLARSGGTLERLAGQNGSRKGPALGLFDNAQFPSCVRSIASGDLIALFTDGLIEAESPQHGTFSEEALFEAVRRRIKEPARELLAGLIAEIQQFCGAAEFADDVCLVGMEVKRLEKPQIKAAEIIS